MKNDWLLPGKLAREITEASVDWQLANVFDCQEFHQRFTLHDSNWICLHVDTGWDGLATAVISLDPIWNSIDAPKTPNCEEWPILLIRFSGLSSIEIQNYQNSIQQRNIATSQSEITDSPKVTTIIVNNDSGQIILKHDDLLEVLVFSFDGRPIVIS